MWRLLNISLAYSDEVLNAIAAASGGNFPDKTIWMTEYNAGLSGGIINGSVHALFQVTANIDRLLRRNWDGSKCFNRRHEHILFSLSGLQASRVIAALRSKGRYETLQVGRAEVSFFFSW